MDGRRLIEALLGTYVATLLLPTLAVTGWVAVTSASPSAILAAGLAIAGAGGLAATTIPNLPERVTSLPVIGATILPPLLFLPYMILAAPDAAPDVYPVVGLLAVLPGMGVPFAGGMLRNRRLRERATEHATVTTGDDDDSGMSRTVVLAAAGGIGLIVAAVGVSMIAFDGFDGSTTLLSSLTGLSSLFLLFGDDGHELAVTDEGLRVNRSMTPWADLSGYRVTDEKIKIERARRWLPSRDFDREEIGDDAAFIDALGEYLPRTEHTTEPAVATTDR